MSNAWKIFYRNVVNKLQTTGSIAPSSRYLAEAITRCIENKDQPLNILEAGPGTGPFTRVLVSKLKPKDHLDLCELNDDFVMYLRECVQNDRVLSAHRDQISLLHQPIETIEGENKYDYIISGLPFNNFPSELVQQILDRYQSLLKPGGKLAFFEYAYVRVIKTPFVWGENRKKVEAIENVLSNHLKSYEKETIFVPLNVPPSIVHICQYS